MIYPGNYAHGWIVPAYTLPENAEKVETLRIVVKENMSITMAENFLRSVEAVLAEFEGKPSELSKPKSGKHMTH